MDVGRECRDVFGIRRLLAQIGDSGDVSRVQPRHGRPRPRMASLSTLTATQLGPLGTREGCPLVPCPENSISGRIGERRILAEKLGFEIDSLYGAPPLLRFGFAARAARTLRFMRQAHFAEVAEHQVSDVQGSSEEFAARGVRFAQAA
jgi:hypothetical protein